MKTISSQIAANPVKHAAGLSAVWQKCMSEAYELEWRMLNGPEHGKLARLKALLGMTRATHVVEYTIKNWSKFARKAAEEVGSDIFPAKPSVGWLCQYHDTAVKMLEEELQSVAKKQAKEEAAKKDAQETVKMIEELKAKHPKVAVLHVTPEQGHAFLNMLEDPAYEAWVDQVSEKYGEWRPAKEGEKGIPCDIELKKAA